MTLRKFIFLKISFKKDIDLQSDSLPVDLTAQQYVQIVGFENGSIRFFDTRLSSKERYRFIYGGFIYSL
jgi:hypothetical protein